MNGSGGLRAPLTLQPSPDAHCLPLHSSNPTPPATPDGFSPPCRCPCVPLPGRPSLSKAFHRHTLKHGLNSSPGFSLPGNLQARGGIPPGAKANMNASRAQLNQITFLTETRKHHWLHLRLGLTTPRICLTSQDTLPAARHQYPHPGARRERAGDGWGDRAGHICLEVLWAGWSQSSDSLPREEGSGPGDHRCASEPSWRAGGSGKRRTSWGSDSPPGLARKVAEASLPAPTRREPWRSSACSSSTSSPAPSR